jgi:undecaprenyl-diphosphatase
LTVAAPSFALDRAQVNPFDRPLMFPYSPGMDTAADLLLVPAMLWPAFLAAAPRSDWLHVTVMYAESTTLAFLLPTAAKHLVTRDRPYRYFEGAPGESDSRQSFFSRHTSLAFCGAVFAGTVFTQYFPDSPWRAGVWAGGLTLAVSVAVFRVAGGNHFTSDVLLGALSGSLVGFLVPWVNHRISPRTAAQPVIMPFGFRIAW